MCVCVAVFSPAGLTNCAGARLLCQRVDHSVVVVLARARYRSPFDNGKTMKILVNPMDPSMRNQHGGMAPQRSPIARVNNAGVITEGGAWPKPASPKRGPRPGTLDSRVADRLGSRPVAVDYANLYKFRPNRGGGRGGTSNIDNPRLAQVGYSDDSKAGDAEDRVMAL